ncbi:ROK family transcriptional regulator [Melghirimyces profundicolus]|uniref:ROK family transcriptional regulator n=1 Tax=Melghirimyces profundicolus TaxID=1242148 RepID=UPI0011B293F5|nr:ROK family transcriptional regulator [Melghirimyces profundicolus]
MLKKMNRTQVLDLIRREGPLSKAQLAERMKLTFAGVSKIVNDLESSGILFLRGEGRSSGGRKPALYALNATAFYVVAVDLSVDEIHVALMDLSTVTVDETCLAAPGDRTPRSYVEAVRLGVQTLLERSGIPRKKILGVGVSSPGPVNSVTGEVLYPPNLPLWNVVPLKERLEQELRMPVKVEKDANLHALGEKWFGAGRGADNLVYVLVGEGIGGGIVIEGSLYRGTPFGAGEIGHGTVDLHGPRCNCGNYGCLEVMASGLAVIRRIREKIRAGHASPHYPAPEKIQLSNVLKAFQCGDDLTIRELEETSRVIAAGLIGVVNSLRPDMLILGGKLSRGFPLMTDIVKGVIRERVVPALSEQLQIVKGELRDKSGLVGAAALVMEEIFTLQLK